MAFVDEVRIQVASGNGGNGVIRWLRTKESARGGPSGGDGGNGGDVVIVGMRDLSGLSRYRFEKKFRAGDGEAGRNELQHGANGADIVLPVPVGTVVSITGRDEKHEIVKEGESVILFRGGTGGRGNATFKSSTNQNPFQQTDGKEGRGGEITLTLKIIADVGLVGLPNAGKSSLLNALTRAKSKVGEYPFTTLEPHLGSFYGYILADIPGLIEGASSGRGLGVRFLKHIERTGIMLHLVSADQDNPIEAYKEVRKEVESFNESLTRKREIVVLSKADLVPPESYRETARLLARETGREVVIVSVEDPEMLKGFSDWLTGILRKGA
jgi:GTP-binding protein